MKKLKKLVTGILTLALICSCSVFSFHTASAVEVGGFKHGQTFNLRNAGSGKYLQVHAGTDANGQNINQWTSHGSTEQKFKIAYNSSADAYKLKAVCSSNGTNRVLDVSRNSNSALAVNANVQQYTGNGTSAQQWKILPNGDGSYRVVSRCSYSTQALDVADISMSNGANIQQYEYWGGENQHWFLNSTYTKYEELQIWSRATGGISSFLDMGHSFIAFYNSTACPVTFGNTTVPKYKTYTAGTWGNLKEFKGIWYNRETNFGSAEMSQYAVLKMDVTAENMAAINSYIYNNNQWSLTTNCSSFASGLWNAVSGNKVNPGIPNTPLNLKNSIQSISNWKWGTVLAEESVGYYDSSWHYSTGTDEGNSSLSTSFTEAEAAAIMQMQNEMMEAA